MYAAAGFLARSGQPYRVLDSDVDPCAKTLVERFHVSLLSNHAGKIVVGDWQWKSISIARLQRLVPAGNEDFGNFSAATSQQPYRRHLTRRALSAAT
ncbi:hypothetical protein ACFX5Q_29300 [Mesorhizobium sp. IMUNJ 23033]|uniref:hypothetical protein n=1 Tax=Mesorhizobium sp. IMUNJ 23033 TaxID=3378039 RepID=UPI00384C2804